jgi:hypothetical protein
LLFREKWAFWSKEKFHSMKKKASELVPGDVFTINVVEQNITFFVVAVKQVSSFKIIDDFNVIKVYCFRYTTDDGPKIPGLIDWKLWLNDIVEVI